MEVLWNSEVDLDVLTKAFWPEVGRNVWGALTTHYSLLYSLLATHYFPQRNVIQIIKPHFSVKESKLQHYDMRPSFANLFRSIHTPQMATMIDVYWSSNI